MKNVETIVTEIVKASAYTVEEIKSDYKKGKSEGWRRGFFAARGFNWLQGQFIEQGYNLR
jgi:hypothetical protein